jgi:hypothetical protein
MHLSTVVHVLWFRRFAQPCGVYVTPTTCVSACVCTGSCIGVFLLAEQKCSDLHIWRVTHRLIDCVGLVIPVELRCTSDRCTSAAAACQHMVCLHISCMVMHLKGVLIASRVQTRAVPHYYCSLMLHKVYAFRKHTSALVLQYHMLITTVISVLS